MLVISFCSLILVIYGFQSAVGQLSADFYRFSCPSVDSIVFETMTDLANKSNVVPPSTLRLFFHDCFIEGCDASIMISSTPTNTAERNLPENNIAQNAFDAVVEAKKAVENKCPGVVSCADIIAMVARDAVRLLGGPTWEVLKGRLDGFISQATRAEGKVPGANSNATQLIDIFASLNMSVQDMVVLSGAHTVGFSHCNQFVNRLYSFSSTEKTDPNMNSSFARVLEKACPQGGDGTKFQAFDITTPFLFDNAYFKNLQLGQGLLFSDQELFTHNSTVQLVNDLGRSQDLFFSSFVASMVKLGNVGVKTDFSNGNIRSDCTAFN
eukprot:Gb_33119 [translate_table: standard]